MNIYFSLLTYSLLSGIFLRVTYDALSVLKTQIFSIPHSVKNASRRESTDSIPPAPIKLQITSTVKESLRILHPSPCKAQIAVTAAVDLLFSLLCAVTVTLLIFGLNFGEIRWFVIPIMAVGYFLYGATLGRPLKKLISRLLATVIKLTVALLHVLTVPIIKPIRAIMPKLSKFIKRSTAPKRTLSTAPQPNNKKMIKKQNFFSKTP